MANIFNLEIEVFTYGTRTGLDGSNYQVAGWMEPIKPMAEAANLTEFQEGYFPPMALYHSSDNHFDLLVADTSRLVTNGLLGKCQPVHAQQVPGETIGSRRGMESRSDTSRSQLSKVQQVLEEPTHLQEEETWRTVPVKSAQSGAGLHVGSLSIGGANKDLGVKGRGIDGGSYLRYLCGECEGVFNNPEILENHMNSHIVIHSKNTFHCDDCDQECESEDALHDHMKEEHDDCNWTCQDCHYQTNSSEQLRHHLKALGHQPSEASKRQSNEIKIFYTCKQEFEGFKAMMEHRVKEHPSNRVCKNIPMCTGFVNGRKCWYLHPSNEAPIPPSQPDKEIECRRCGKKFPNRNQFMDHYTSEHTSHIVCRDWVKAKCNRIKCWYRHSHLQNLGNAPAQPVPKPQDFPQLLPPPQPPAWRPVAAPVPQALTKTQLDIQAMISTMALRMNTMELEISESRKNMHKLQQMLASTQI